MKNGGKHKIHHQSVNPEGGAARVKSSIPKGTPVKKHPRGAIPTGGGNVAGNVTGRVPGK